MHLNGLILALSKDPGSWGLKLLWLNSEIEIGGKPVLYQRWAKADVFFINDLLIVEASQQYFSFILNSCRTQVNDDSGWPYRLICIIATSCI
jgi:hypothetical protein